MCGKSLVTNLLTYLDGVSGIDIPVYSFDRNNEKQLPCIVVGYEREELSFAGGYGHYTVSAYTNICFQGYEDANNNSAEHYAELAIDALNDVSGIRGAINAPVSGMDTRGAKKFRLNGLVIRGIDRSIEGLSEEISIRYDAYCAARD